VNDKPKRLSASQSFSVEEVEAMHELFSKLLLGADLKILRRAPVYAKLHAKITAMKHRVLQVRKERGE